MPSMVPLSGKAKKIKEQILGSPRNEHYAYSRDPRIRESDIQRVQLALINGQIANAMNLQNQPYEGMQ